MKTVPPKSLRVPRGTVPQDFWTSPTLDELAQVQNVGPLDARALVGTWPGEDDDGFDEAIDELRYVVAELVEVIAP